MDKIFEQILVGTLVALLVALFTWISVSFVRFLYLGKARLKMYFDPNETYQTAYAADSHTQGFFCHVMILNRGRASAKNCFAQVIDVQYLDEAGHFQKHPGFMSAFRLKWAHAPTFSAKDIEPKLPSKLDICYALQSSPSSLHFFTEKSPSGNQTDFPAGVYLFKLRVYSDNVGSQDSQFAIEYSGEWNRVRLYPYTNLKRLIQQLQPNKMRQSHQPATSLPPGIQAYLSIAEASGNKSQFTIKSKSTLIGRDQKLVDVIIDHPTVSAIQCEIVFETPHFYIKTARKRPLYPTTVNGEPLGLDKVLLVAGDRIALGRVAENPVELTFMSYSTGHTAETRYPDPGVTYRS